MTLPTPDKLRERAIKVRHFTHNYRDFIRLRVEYHVNSIVVDEIIERMRQAEFSEKVWMNTKLDHTSFTNDRIRVWIKSEYYAESGFDVALAREFGTDQKSGGRHRIKPKAKIALSWISQGIRMFSKGHFVSGMKALRIINSTIEEKKQEVQDALDADYKEWSEKILS